MLKKYNFELTISYGEYNVFYIYDRFLMSMPTQLFERIFQTNFFHVIQYPRNSPQKIFTEKLRKKIIVSMPLSHKLRLSKNDFMVFSASFVEQRLFFKWPL